MKVKFFSIFTVAASMLFAGSVFAQAMNVPTIKAEQVMSGLENPWDMAFTNGGDMFFTEKCNCLLYTSPSPRDAHESRMPSSA